MKKKLRGLAHDFVHHLLLLAENPRTDPFYVLAEHDLTDLRETRYWSEFKRIIDAYGFCGAPMHVLGLSETPTELCSVDVIAVYSDDGRRKRIDLVFADRDKSVEASITRSGISMGAAVGEIRKSPHPDCRPPGWIKGPKDVKNTVALITKPSFYPRIAEVLADIPVDVYGVGMPGRTSIALLQKYKRVLYLDDLDPCGVRRYLEWKKIMCPEYVGIRVEWLRGLDLERFKIEDNNQWVLIENEIFPPELEEERRFLMDKRIVELEDVTNTNPEIIVSAVWSLHCLPWRSANSECSD